MPTALINKIIDKCGIASEKAEKYWEKAKDIAKEKVPEDSKNFYPYVVGIFKKMIGKDCQDKMGWLSKSEELLIMVEDYGTYNFYMAMVNQSIKSETGLQAIQRVKEAIDNDEKKFFYELFKYYVRDNYIVRDDEEICKDISRRLMEFMRVAGVLIDSNKALTIKNLSKYIVKRYAKEEGDNDIS